VISGAATICEGATTPLQVTITGGTSPYSITVNNGVGTINNYVSGTNIPVTPAATSTYLLTAVSDANGCVSSSLSGSAVVTVNFCNSSPVANDDNGGSLTEDGSNGTVSVLSNDTDPDGNPSAPTNGVGQFSVDLDPVTAGIQISFTNPAGTWTYDPVTGIVTFDPADNYYGTATMTYELCDPNAACDQAVVTFIVTPVNDPPVISDNTGTTPEDTPVTVCTSFTDVDGTGPYTVTLSCVDDGAATYVINADEVCVTYTPDLNFNGKDTVCIHLCDAGGACSDAEVVITVTPVNDPPVIDNEYISVAVNGTGSGDLTDAGDSDIDGNLVVNTTPVIGPSNGSILINADGTYTYTPDPGYTVSDQIVVEICDDGTPLPAICVNDTIFITVLPTNPPVAANDNASTSEDTSVTFNVTGNDTDSDGTINTGTVDLDPGTAGIQTSYTNTYGTWTVDASGNVTFNPAADFNGTATVIYTVNDNDGATSNTATITVIVSPVNDPPVVDNEILNTPEDTPVSGDLTDAGDYDVDGNLIVNTTPLSGPDNGTIIINADGTFTYTPSLNFNGNDTIVVEICDDGTPLPALCTNDTIFITITPVNDPPVAADTTISTPEDTPVTVCVPFTDVDGSAPYTATLSCNDDGSASYVINAGEICITYTPDGDYNGNDTVCVHLCDAGGACTDFEMVITVTPVNDPPVTANETETVSEDSPLTGTILTPADIDPDGDNLTVITTPVAGPDNGSISMNSDGTYIYIPDPDYYGTDMLVFQICDDGTPVLCAFDTLFITVIPVNDAPVAVNDVAGTDPGVPVDVNVGINDSDEDGPTLTWTIITPPDSGIATINGSIITYTPNPGVGTSGQVIDTLWYEVCDNGTPNLCDTAMVVIYIPNTPLPPVVTNEHVTGLEDTPLVIDVTGNDYDPNGDPLTITPGSGTTPNGSWLVDVNGDIVYTPNPDFNGNDTLIVEVCDPTPNCVNDTIFIVIDPVNDAPIVTNDTATTLVNTPVSGSLIGAGETDPDGTMLLADVNPVSGPDNGTIVINTDGTYTYTPDNGFTGQDTVVVEICDNGIPQPPICVYDTLFITINSSLPPSIPDTTVVTPQDSTITFCLDITDAEGNGPYTIGNINCADMGAVGAVVNANEVCITYVPTPGVTGTDTLCITLCDAAGSCETYEPVVIIIPPNDPPVIPDTTVVTPQDSTITFCLDITDTEGDVPYTVASINCADLGNVTAVVNGTEVCITYVPTAGVTGTDTLCITLCDAAGSCETYEPVVIIIPSNDPPVIPDTTVSTPQDSTITFCLEITDTENDLPYTISNINCEDLGAVSAVITGNEICITYVPTPGVSGIDTLCVTICDAAGSCETYNPVVIIVPDVNTPPHVNDTTVTIQQDSTVIICMDIIDAEGNSPYSATVGCEDNGTVTWIINGNQLCVTFTPNAGFTGTDSLCVIICDAAGACDSSVIVVIVIPPVSVLIANPDFRTTKTNTPVVITILDNDVAPNSTFDLSSISVTQYPLHGSVIINSNGTATYTPDAYYTGTDIFIYNVCNNDFNPACDTAKVTIVIEPNDLTIPTGFSPDKDGVNETFVITGIEKFPNAILQIYNRWGNLVFESEIPYRNDWDGTSNVRGVAFGSDLPEATYFYLLETGTEEKPYSGYVILKRNQ
jgi:gliding motility-associated-like protein